MAFSIVVIQHNEPQADMTQLIQADTGQKNIAGKRMMNYFRALLGSARSAIVSSGVSAVKATGTITLSSHVATDTVTVNGIVFTCVASGATGNQYNVGGTDALTADALAAAINANATLVTMVVATSALGVVTLTAYHPTALGNAVTIAISAHGSVSAARLAGGTNGGQERSHSYGSN